jgi:hypothetical protein
MLRPHQPRVEQTLGAWLTYATCVSLATEAPTVSSQDFPITLGRQSAGLLARDFATDPKVYRMRRRAGGSCGENDRIRYKPTP